MTAFQQRLREEMVRRNYSPTTIRTQCMRCAPAVRAAESDMSALPAGSLLVFYASDPRGRALVGAGTCVLAKTIVDLAGTPSAVILIHQS